MHGISSETHVTCLQGKEMGLEDGKKFAFYSTFLYLFSFVPHASIIK